MCSRFELSADPERLARRFRLTIPPPFPFKTELRPTDSVLVIGAGPPRLMPWGLSVEWQSGPLINARAETLAAKSTFRPLLGQGRILVPATAWWEWREDELWRIKTRIAPVDGEPITFAGLTDGKRVVIITCAPSAALASVHDRMPVVVTPEAEARWLDSAIPFAEATKDLTPHDGPFQLSEETPPPSRQGDLFG